MSRPAAPPARAAALLALLFAAAPPLAAPAAAQPLPAFTWPRETSRFVEAPGVERAQRYCLTCHSADYVATQPRGMPQAFWDAEVAKMRSAYGASVPDAEAKALVQYLAAAYAAAPPKAP